MEPTINLEQERLAKVNHRIQAATNRAAVLRDQAGEAMADLKKRGVSAKDPDASHLIGQIEGRLEGSIDEIANLNVERQKVIDALVEAVPNLGGARDGRGGMPLAYGPEQLRDAFERVSRHKQPISLGGEIGFNASALDTGAVPMSDVGDFRVQDIWPFLRERPSIFDLFPLEVTDRNQVTVYKGVAGASAAAAVAAGAVKPTSSPDWDPVNLPVEVIAHIGTVNLQVLHDFGNAFQVIGSEFMSGLLLAIDNQILSGSGVTPNLTGILSAGIPTITRDATNETRHGAVLRALTAVRISAFVEPTVIVVHPTDLYRTMEETTTIESYLSPTDTQQLPSLWGVRIVSTTAISEGTALVLNPKALGRVFLRQAPSLEINPWGETEWTRNQASIRNEARLAFGVVQPNAACEILNFG